MSAAEGPVHVAVVGHTNTGKTSLLRTLTRDVAFGEVSNRPAVTRHVEGKALLVDGQPVVELYDTPGLEDSGGLLDHLDDLARRAGDRRPDWVGVVEAFLDSPAASRGFAQEASALRQVLRSEVALYVIDARDRVLGKHRDELEILARCARPVVPVLNFTASPDARTAEWREHLARVNMHAVAEFDTVVVDEDGERRLYEKMATLLDRRRATFDLLVADRRRQRAQLFETACRLIADLLIDVAGFVTLVEAEADGTGATPPARGGPGAEAVGKGMETMRERIRDREQRCLQQLLELYRFRRDDGRLESLSIVDGRWGMDLFEPAVMKRFGVRAGGAAAAGAMAGLAVDAMVGGITLGAATATGAAIGALLETGRSFGRRLVDRARGWSELRPDDATLRVLLVRQLALLRALQRRGHAATEPVTVESGGGGASGDRGLAALAANAVARRIPAPLQEARARPEWSALTRRVSGRVRALSASSSEARELAEAELGAWIGECVPHEDPA